MFSFIFFPVGSILAGITSFSFREGLDTTSPGGWWWRAAGDSKNKANSAAGARLSLAILRCALFQMSSLHVDKNL